MKNLINKVNETVNTINYENLGVDFYFYCKDENNNDLWLKTTSFKELLELHHCCIETFINRNKSINHEAVKNIFVKITITTTVEEGGVSIKTLLSENFIIEK